MIKHLRCRTACVICLFVMASPLGSSRSFAESREQFDAAVKNGSANSPAGGPTKNPAAAVFVLFRKSRTLCWVSDGKLQSAAVTSPRETDDTKAGGPTPPGEYLIDKPRKHPGHNIDWCNLYPRKEDASGYYKYHEATKTGRKEMGLHPGTISLGCVTVTAADYDQSAVWKSIRKKIDASTLKYKGGDYAGFLYVVD